MQGINPPKPLLYFYIPFLVLAGLMVWTSYRISIPDEAVENARQFLEEKIPGTQWQVGKVVKAGEGMDKRWRLELSASQKDGRMAQATLLVDRWRPGHVVGRFVMLFGPPQIVDGGWDTPSNLDILSKKIPRATYFIAGAIFFGLQCFWLYRSRRRNGILRRDGIVLAIFGLGLLWNQLVLEVHPAYMAGYALIISFIVWSVFSADRINGGV